jgi:hypothetical protein
LALSHLFRLLIARLGLLSVSGDKRDAEILALRHQVLVMQRQIDRVGAQYSAVPLTRHKRARVDKTGRRSWLGQG